ncbi:centrosomal protein 15 [Chanos chanos]|uniref:Centrosomal protein 15 n=1 Tax=Chanos chanos TaxID=29144 RepID=A0A6J2VMQ7_CHACN|nr:uncharacterized protein C3orf14 homolog [Chanos chanos]
MASNPCEEAKLSKKHEEILGKRVELLQKMESQYEQQKVRKKQQSLVSEAAQKRNAQLLQDLQELENRLRTKTLLHPDVINLETRYWASVEENLPAWERYFLGKGHPPVDEVRKSPGHRKQKEKNRALSPPQDKGRPPLPRTKSAM